MMDDEDSEGTENIVIAGVDPALPGADRTVVIVTHEVIAETQIPYEVLEDGENVREIVQRLVNEEMDRVFEDSPDFGPLDPRPDDVTRVPEPPRSAIDFSKRRIRIRGN